jgi:hypothetical protein
MMLLRTLPSVAAVLAMTGCNLPQEALGPLVHDTQTIALDKSEILRVNLSMGVGELTLDTGSAQLMDADFSYNVPSWKPQVDYRPGASRSELSITQPHGGHGFSNADNKWNVKLSEKVGLDLQAKLGVGEVHMNLAKANLRSIELSMGVGEVHLDLKGTPKRSYDVRIKGGVGEAHVAVPRNVGILATAKGGIGDINVHGLEQKGQYWINPGHENDAVVIRLDISGGVGEITVDAE